MSLESDSVSSMLPAESPDDSPADLSYQLMDAPPPPAAPGVEAAPVEAAPTVPHAPVRSRSFWRDVRDTVVMVLAIYTLVNLIAPRYIVEGASMQPNFETGEWIIVTRLPYLMGEPHRGDVVILDFEPPQEDLIKRLIGLPGETIEIRDGLVFVNGEPLNEPYINAPPRYRQEAITLGPDEYYVLGDNRNNSRDSHAFGPVAGEHIMGRAWLIYWPPPDWGFIPSLSYDQPVVYTPTPVDQQPVMTPSPVYIPPVP